MLKICKILILIILSISVKAQVLRPSGFPTTNSPARFDITGYQQDSAFLYVLRDSFPAKYPSVIYHPNGNLYKTVGGTGAHWTLITDTTFLSNRINLRVKYTDTSSMLTPYHAAFYNATFDTTTRIFSLTPITGNPPITFVIPRGGSVNGMTTVTPTRSGNIITQTADNGAVWQFSVRDADSATVMHTTDTAAMLVPYLRKSDTAGIVSGYVRSVNVATTPSVSGSSSGGQNPVLTINVTGAALSGVVTDVRAGTGMSVANNGGVFTVTNSSPSSGGTVTAVSKADQYGFSSTISTPNTTPVIRGQVDTTVIPAYTDTLKYNGLATKYNIFDYSIQSQNRIVSLWNTSDSANYFGDSYTTGFRLDNPLLAWSYLTSNRYVKTRVNYAQSGTGAWVAAKNANQNLLAGNKKPSFGLFGLNDFIRTNNTVKTSYKIQAAIRCVAANTWLQSYSNGNSAEIVTTGWTTYDVTALGGKALTNGKITSSTSSTMSFTSSGTNFVVGTFAVDGTRYKCAAFNVLVNDSLYTTYNGNGKTDGVNNLNPTNDYFQPDAIFITNLDSGVNTIKVVPLSNDTTYIDYIGVLQPPQESVPYIMGTLPRLNAGGYALYGGSDTAWTRGDSAIRQAIVSLFPFKAAWADIDKYYSTSNLMWDSIHPNSAGQRQFAQAFSEQINDYQLPTQLGNSSKALTTNGNGSLTWESYSPSTAISGTTNFLPKFTTSSTIGNSNVAQSSSGGRVLINVPTDDGSSLLQVNGSIHGNNSTLSDNGYFIGVGSSGGYWLNNSTRDYGLYFDGTIVVVRYNNDDSKFMFKNSGLTVSGTVVSGTLSTINNSVVGGSLSATGIISASLLTLTGIPTGKQLKALYIDPSGNVYKADTSAISSGGITSIASTVGISSSVSGSGAVLTNTGVVQLLPTANQISLSQSTGIITASLPSSVIVSSSISTTDLYGTIQTVSQPNITTVGTLTALTVSGAITGGSFNGAGTGITGLTNANLSGSAGITNANLANSSVTVTAGTGLGGGGAVSLGGSVTLSNTGVTSIIAGSNITISGSAGAVTINATGGGSSGVSSIAGSANQITTSASTGAVTLSIPSALIVSSTISSVGVYGTLQTAAQPNITSVGTLTTLNISAGASTRSKLLISDGNTASVLLAGGASLPGTLSSDVGLALRTSVSYPNPDGGMLALFLAASTGAAQFASTVDAPGNITSLAAVNSAGLTVTNNATVGGNLTVTGGISKTSGGSSTTAWATDGSTIPITNYWSRSGTALSTATAGDAVTVGAAGTLASTGNYNTLTYNVTDGGATLNSGSPLSANYGELDYTSSSNRTVGNSNIVAGQTAIMKPVLTGTPTITFTQGSGSQIRAMTANTSLFYVPSSAANTRTITHAAGLRTGLYAENSSNVYTITNYYGLIVGASDEYQTTNITNRWGIYQEGANDKNLLAGTVRMSAYGAGAATFDASGNITSTSDGRLKYDKGTIPDAISLIMRLKTGHYYKWKKESGMETDSTYFSLFANEVHSALGEQFAPSQPIRQIRQDSGKTNATSPIKYYGLNDRALLSLTIQALQEANNKVDALEIRLAKLEAIINKQKP